MCVLFRCIPDSLPKRHYNRGYGAGIDTPRLCARRGAADTDDLIAHIRSLLIDNQQRAEMRVVQGASTWALTLVQLLNRKASSSDERPTTA